MQIAFSQLIENEPIGHTLTSSMRTSLLKLLSRRIILQIFSSATCLALGFAIGICLIANSLHNFSHVTHVSNLTLGILISLFCFSLITWYLIQIWYESEWIDSIKTSIDTYKPQLISSEKKAQLFFEEAQFFRSPTFSPCVLPGIIQKIPFSRSLQEKLNQIIIFFFWKKKLDIVESLMISSASNRIDVIQDSPLDPKAHAELANSYVSLSQLFQDAKSFRNRYGFYSKIPYPKHAKEVDLKHTHYAKLAVQELMIVSQFAQDALWVFEQLAMSYRELEMHEEELEAWTQVLKLAPDDIQAYVRTGLLAFQLKLPKIGLEAYSKLKEISPLQACEVISAYKECLK